jgi:hypothetical protein
MLCSAPVFEAEATVTFHGLHVHQPCYHRESEFPNRETRRRTLALA